MLLSKVHVQLQIWKVGGQQTKYSGHTILFPRDTATFAERLPLLPSELDVIVVRRKDAPPNAAMAQHLDFTVNRARVLANLEALRRYHPSYRHINIDRQALASLPENGSVFDEFPAVEEDSDPLPQDDHDDGPPADEHAAPDDLDISAALLPNIVDDVPQHQRVVEGLQALVEGVGIADESNVVTQPALRSTPINEHETSSQHLIDAFPFLYPQGLADVHAPRNIAPVNHEDYFRHLMRYEDGRFAQHPRFRSVILIIHAPCADYRYYALNSMMRSRSKSASRFFVKRNRQHEPLTAQDITEMLELDAERLAAKVTRWGAHLRGTPQYWKARAKELEQMVRQIGPPAIFLTLSAADLQWPDLHRHLPAPPPNLTEALRQRHNSRSLNDNPAVASWYFQQRWQDFLSTVVKPLFGVTDYWFRYEWQSRGSSHVHALLWVDAAPEVQELRRGDAATHAAFAEYWASRMTAFNPSAFIPPATQHPSARSFNTLSYTNRELAELLNRCQRHTRCSAYCLRRRRGAPPDEPKVCRFKFPKELSDRPSIAFDDNGRPTFNPLRNDPLLNAYNAVISTAWRANTDVTVVADRHAVLSYIAKYVSKAEVSSLSAEQLITQIAHRLESNTKFRVVAQKLLNRSVGDRDWSAQEVCHLLLGCSMYGASRSFTSLGLLEDRSRMTRQMDLEALHDDDDHGDAIEGSDWLDAYYARPANDRFESLSVYTWFKRWEKGRSTAPKHKRKDKIVRLWPPYAPSTSGTLEHENWCRAKLLLHHPHRDRDTFDIRLPGESWETAWDRCMTQCAHPLEPDTLPVRRGGGADLTESEHSDTSIETFRDQEDFHLLAAQGPRAEAPDGDEFSRLGQRDVDVHHDWMADARGWGAEGLDARVSHLQQAKLLVRACAPRSVTLTTAPHGPRAHHRHARTAQ
jgi:hypothetical protein